MLNALYELGKLWIEKENLDVRTITMGISLLDCIDSDLENCKKIAEKYNADKGRIAITGLSMGGQCTLMYSMRSRHSLIQPKVSLFPAFLIIRVFPVR